MLRLTKLEWWLLTPKLRRRVRFLLMVRKVLLYTLLGVVLLCIALMLFSRIP